MKKGKISLFILLCLMLCITTGIVGCSKEQKTTNSEETTEEIHTTESDNEGGNEMDLTMEYVCSEFGIPESEFEGVDFDSFVEYYGLTYENIHRESVEYLLNEYKKNNGEIEFYDYKYMNNPTNGMILTSENQDDLSVLYCSKVEGDLRSFWIFDFEKGIIIADTGTDQVIHKDKIIATLSDKDKEDILVLFSKYDVYSWYENKENLTSGEWYLSVEFKDGTIAGVSGSSIDENTDFDGLLSELKVLGE